MNKYPRKKIRNRRASGRKVSQLSNGSCNPFLVSLGYGSVTTEIKLVYSKAKSLAWLIETAVLARALIAHICGKAAWRTAVYFGNEASSPEWNLAIFPRDVATHYPVPQLHIIQTLKSLRTAWLNQERRQCSLSTLDGTMLYSCIGLKTQVLTETSCVWFYFFFLPSLLQVKPQPVEGPQNNIIKYLLQNWLEGQTHPLITLITLFFFFFKSTLNFLSV